MQPVGFPAKLQVPKAVEVPFKVPADRITDKDLIPIVETVREKTEEPILFMSARKGKIYVETGIYGDLYSNHGRGFEFKKDADHYNLKTQSSH